MTGPTVTGANQDGAGSDDPAILYSPAAERNREPILAVLRRLLPGTGLVLEIASGPGQHIVAFASALPDLAWQPSDPDPAARASIDARAARAGVANVRQALDLDVTRPGWEGALARPVDAVLCVNLLHIAPWQACEGLMRGVGQALRPDGFLYLYGPYSRDGRHTAPSNATFDRDLRRRNPEWGVRDLSDVAQCGRRNGLRLDEVIEMPANNLSVVFRAIG